ncbi:helix-turn-helix domain-containing protein [uncultured Pseudomonas sp.]|uniref:helix-turn-helix domain-containing protein n=1 Tax=uncultured Pseudomonas sp. TaxID=114707 RepID=UPI00261989B3|nr:helix-turn-helix domain-containing protein [uncultured Pseudomonas sp.]
MAISEGVCWRGKAWVSPGLGIFLGYTGSHERHSHMAHQVTIGLGGQVTVRAQSQALTAPAICIKAGTLHQIEGDEVLSIYLDALSEEARAMNCIAAAQLVSIPAGNTSAIEQLLETPELPAQLVREEVRRLLGLKMPQAADPRMRAVLQALEERQDDRARLAELVHLSPTRFSHWFVEQTGLPLRSYRKWSRLVVALRFVSVGHNLTAAAHAAGFADAAHFSRSFRALFGLDPSSALGHVRLRS